MSTEANTTDHTDPQRPGARILIVEDELAMRNVLNNALERHGYRVLIANDGEQGLERALKEEPDLILLDVMMPKLSGFEVCAELRRLGRTVPILMLTAKGSVDDKVKGLDAGADDYLAKPFSRDEMLARVRALLRRVERKERELTVVEFSDVKIDFTQQRVWKADGEVALTVKEFGMLRLLLETPGEPVSRERFLDVVWGYTAYPVTRTVDKHVVSLRQKIENDPDSPEWIKTVHGVGYRMELPEAGGECA